MTDPSLFFIINIKKFKSVEKEHRKAQLRLRCELKESAAASAAVPTSEHIPPALSQRFDRAASLGSPKDKDWQVAVQETQTFILVSEKQAKANQ